MAGLTPTHLLILSIALIVVGPGKLPEVGASIGKSVRVQTRLPDPGRRSGGWPSASARRVPTGHRHNRRTSAHATGRLSAATDRATPIRLHLVGGSNRDRSRQPN
ncbi:MAG: twin-arginine translocase TatA/TatE family subunit [Candidatus Limnocylindrales bacterium]